MKVQVRLFAGLRERAGTASLDLELPEGASVGDALGALGSLCEGVPVVMAVNRDYADRNVVLSQGDEVALIPPVSGGAGEVAEGSVLARVVSRRLSLDAVMEAVSDPRAGAVVTFSGVTRDVPALEYEAYAEMAEAKLAEIAAAAVSRHGLCAAAVEHRVGVVPLSEASVVIAASAPHRAEAFAGAREIIDALKTQAPIWKKEEGQWVQGKLPESA